MSNLDADHELGQFREKPEATDIMRLAINLVNDFQPQGYDQSIKIFVDQDSFRKVFGKRQIQIEKNLIAQAISNIIENGVKYADRDSTIKVSAVSSSAEVGVSLESIGIPITEAEKDEVFGRGYRGRAARQKVAAGTGFGLYLASRVMTFHGGRIELETLGKRSRFLLLFPSNRLTTGN